MLVFTITLLLPLLCSTHAYTDPDDCVDLDNREVDIPNGLRVLFERDALIESAYSLLGRAELAHLIRSQPEEPTKAQKIKPADRKKKKWEERLERLKEGDECLTTCSEKYDSCKQKKANAGNQFGAITQTARTQAACHDVQKRCEKKCHKKYGK